MPNFKVKLKLSKLRSFLILVIYLWCLALLLIFYCDLRHVSMKKSDYDMLVEQNLEPSRIDIIFSFLFQFILNCVALIAITFEYSWLIAIFSITSFALSAAYLYLLVTIDGDNQFFGIALVDTDTLKKLSLLIGVKIVVQTLVAMLSALLAFKLCIVKYYSENSIGSLQQMDSNKTRVKAKFDIALV